LIECIDFADNRSSNIGWYDCDNRNDDCSNRGAAVAQWYSESKIKGKPKDPRFKPQPGQILTNLKGFSNIIMNNF
jgi:hypothetical protein